MEASQERILTTHAGSLPRTVPVLDAMKARLSGEDRHENAYQTEVRQAVCEVVGRQIACGIDIVTDGEMSKTGFFSYVDERIEGFAPQPDEPVNMFVAEKAAFPEYYEQYFARAIYGAAIKQIDTMTCVAPIRYKGHDALQRDIDNLKSALDGLDCEDIFMPAVSPAGIGTNSHYGTEEEFAEALAEALREEYEAIVEAGFLLQIDDPFLCDMLVDPALDDRQRQDKANLYVDAINHAVRHVPEDRIRYHTCYGINQGPRIHEAPMREVAGYMLRIKAGAYSFEAANPRHEHEYRIWEDLKLPEGRILIPGVITHSSNIVEHPEFIAERIARFAQRVGRERVIAGGDCGFSSQACYHTEVHPTVIWAKFEAMAEGARLATRQLW